MTQARAKNAESVWAGRGGFTMPELLVGASLGAMALGVAFIGIGMAARMSRDGTEQVGYNAIGRVAAQKIGRCIEEARAATVVNGTRVELVMPDLRVASLCFQDGDPETTRDNVIVFDADTSVFGDERVLCSQVSAEGGAPVFVRASSGAIRAAFRVGGGGYSPGRPFGEGVLVALTVMPRNATRWYGQ